MVPEQTITRVLNPPSTDTETKSYTVAGVNPADTSTGLITTAQVVSGKWFGAKPADEILVNTAYASTNSIKVGQKLTIDKTVFTVVGLVNPTLAGDTSDIYFDLPTLQALASNSGRVNEVLVKVAKSSDVSAVAAAIHKKLPGAQVLTDKELSGQVTGSLSNAHTLATHLGGALAVIVLLAAFLIAALLTLSSIAKRVREIGTLRAIGWSRGRVVRQIVAETLGIGILGGVLGVGLGIAVCAIIGAVGPALSSTSSVTAVGTSSVGGHLPSGHRRSTDVLQGPSAGSCRCRHRPPGLRLGLGWRAHRRSRRRLAGVAPRSCHRTAGPRMNKDAKRRGDLAEGIPIMNDDLVENTLYELRGVERRYMRGSTPVLALHDVDLDIRPGEFVSMEGPSGSGKSTLLQLLGALDTPTSGTIRFEGNEMSSASDVVLTRIRGQEIGFVFQQFNLIPTLTAAENVGIAMIPHDHAKTVRRERSAELLERVGLGGRLDHLPSRMSGGEQQRVAIARALANRPRVIIADEPTGNLDSASAQEVMALLNELQSGEEAVTIVVATHDPDVATRAGRRIRLRDGAVVTSED